MRPPDDAIASAWFTPSQLAQIARQERQRAEIQTIVLRRELFEARVAEASKPLSNEQMRALWDAADTEAKGDG